MEPDTEPNTPQDSLLWRSKWGNYHLQRYPARPGSALQAWNSADELLLEAARDSGMEPAQTLLVNDEHGALFVALPGAALWTDSFLSVTAAQRNWRRNNDAEHAPIILSTQTPEQHYTAVLLRVPKQLSLLRWQLGELRRLLPAGTPILCAGMDKHLPRGLGDLLERFVGPTERFPGKRKARLFRSCIDSALTAIEPAQVSADCPPLAAQLVSCPNVFSRDKPDSGSLFMLEHLAAPAPDLRIVDLGCGNGILGLAAASHHPQQLNFVDESALALQAARANQQQLFPDLTERCNYLFADGLTDYQLPAPDLVLCNPPFHNNHVVDAYFGQRLLRQVSRQLARHGEFWVVANRHLAYEQTLKKGFASVNRQAQNRKYTLWRARGPR
jgi:23S rRNA (guanine1835-N2)-methyltransferase